MRPRSRSTTSTCCRNCSTSARMTSIASSPGELLIAGPGDAGSSIASNALVARTLPQLQAGGTLAARRPDGVAKIPQELGVLPAHDVRHRVRREARRVDGGANLGDQI